MALEDRVKERVPEQRLINLTNDKRGVTTIDNAILGFAARDTEADLEIFAGVAFDETDKRIVVLAVEGVILHLLKFKGESRFEVKLDAWRTNLNERLRLVTGNNRIKPKTSSRLTPAVEAPGGEIVRPFFDAESSFDDVIPEQKDTGRPRSFGS